MRETASNGKTIIYMPKDRQSAAHQLGKLSALAASREWERAALVALMVSPGRAGRPRKNVDRRAQISAQEKYSISEFTRLGIYGLSSVHAVRAYLKAWDMSGQDAPEWGRKIEVPDGPFPDFSDLYRSDAAPEPEPEETHEEPSSSDEEDTPDGDTTPQPRDTPRPSPRGADPISGFLKVLDRMDPSDVIAGQSPDQVSLLIKTMESWLESLKDAAAEDDEAAA